MGVPSSWDCLTFRLNFHALTRVSLAEFKEIRKEWKARKKEEENQRKAEEERARAAAAQANPADGPPGDNTQPPPGYQQGGRQQVQLPPIGYQPGAQVPGQYQAPPGGVQQLQEYSNNHMYSGYPASPYGAPNQMYSQRHYT
jgi:transcription factor CON7